MSDPIALGWALLMTSSALCYGLLLGFIVGWSRRRPPADGPLNGAAALAQAEATRERVDALCSEIADQTATLRAVLNEGTDTP